MTRHRSDAGGVYVHVPFCVRKCSYCAFLSAPATAEQMALYTDYLVKEIVLRGDMRAYDTIFLGGGTPSLLNPTQIARIINEVKKYFCLVEDPEITMEANPATLTAESLRGYRKAGVNRLSIGVQSLCDETLRVLGRIHSAADAKREFKLAREAGFDNINIDLMFSVPGSTVEEVLRDIEAVCELGPEHISFYSLQLEEGTPMMERFLRGEVQEVPDEVDREMYHRGIRLLSENGYEQYEISNFCRDGRISKHNYKYWSMNEYIGLGLGASSYLKSARAGDVERLDVNRDSADELAKSTVDADGFGGSSDSIERSGASSYRGGIRTINVSTMDEYMRMLDAGLAPIQETHENTKSDDVSEAVFTGLRRTEGILFKEILGSREEFFEYYRDAAAELTRFEEGGFLEIDDEGMRLTEWGFDVSNKIMALMV